MRTATAIGLAVTMLLLAGCATSVRAGDDELSGWVAVDEFPLEPRGAPVIVWTGEEVIVAGGELGPPCPPTADCVTGPSAEDGAALDPWTGRWRELAEAPLPIHPGSGAFAGGHLFAWADADGVGRALLSYGAGEDEWSEVDVPDDLPRTLIADGDDLLLPLASHESGGGADLVLDVATGEWSELPADPLGAMFDRYLTATPDGILLTGKAFVESAGAAEPPLVQVALYDRDTGAWKRLPDAEQIGGWNWRWTGTRAVDVTLGGADGGEIDGWGREYPFGGVVSVPDGEWSELPDAPRRAGAVWLGSAIGGGRYVLGDGHVFDDVDETWTLLPSPPDAPDAAGDAIWADDRLVVVGGTDWSGIEGTRDVRSWVFTP
ncbi:hypothetical protein [Microbacterium sp. NPDC056234]|uniref:hypothetical protein n=1 Tax=Microbacterium sp. NPDC056234 TaxID=3345757 RepID=UPI0035DDB15C